MASGTPPNAVLLPASTWSKVKAMSAGAKTRLNQGADKDQVVCETLQRCFDVIVEDHIGLGAEVNFPLLHHVIPDKVLESAVALEWLEPVMRPDKIALGHREWFMRLLEGRIEYFEACEIGRPFGHEHQKPDFVVTPIPETDPMIQLVKPREEVQALRPNDPISVCEDVLRAGVEARGIRPESPEFELEFFRALGDLAKKYGRPVKVVGRWESTASRPAPALPSNRKTPSQLLMEYKVNKKIRTHELVADALGLERSVYFDLKAGRRVSEETYVKAALGLECTPDDLKP